MDKPKTYALALLLAMPIAGLSHIGTHNTGTAYVKAFAKLTAPAVTTSIKYGHPGSQPIISFAGPIVNGKAPFTVKLYRSPNWNLNTSGLNPDPANDPEAKLLTQQTIVDNNSAPMQFTDASAPSGLNQYTCVVSDSNQPAESVASINDAASSCVILAPWTGPNVLVISDSVGQGSQADQIDNYISPIARGLRYPTAVRVTTGGSNYSSSVTATCAEIPGSKFGVVTAGGVVKNVYIIDPGDNPLSQAKPYTVTINDSTGSGATATISNAGVGGGWPLMLQDGLQAYSGMKDVRVLNCSLGGSSMHYWLNTWVMQNAVYSMAAIGGQWVVIVVHGINDAQNYADSPAQFEEDTKTVCTTLVGSKNVQTVLLVASQFGKMNNSPQGTHHWLLQQYAKKMKSVAAMFPEGKVEFHDPGWFNLTLAHQDWIQGTGNHMNPYGNAAMATSLMPIVASKIGLK